MKRHTLLIIAVLLSAAFLAGCVEERPAGGGSTVTGSPAATVAPTGSEVAESTAPGSTSQTGAPETASPAATLVPSATPDLEADSQQAIDDLNEALKELDKAIEDANSIIDELDKLD